MYKMLMLIFKESFEGKTARVYFSNNGGYVGTGMEHAVEIKCIGISELVLLSTKNDYYLQKYMEENFNTFANNFSETFREKKEIECNQYKFRDAVKNMFDAFIKETQITLGRVFLHNVKEFKIEHRTFNKKDYVYSITLFYEGGAKTEITLETENFKKL